MALSYLIDKINESPFESEPYKHLYIENFFSDEHFAELQASEHINVGKADSDKDLVDRLMSRGFEAIPFPGTTTDLNHYLSWHRDKDDKHSNIEICEGFGLALRLTKLPEDSIVTQINDYFNSEEFLNCIAEKFGLTLSDTYPDNGLQKYLDGYEISPHPDIRKKALTYMINVNPAEKSEDVNFHTHYMKFTSARAYVQSYWEGNPKHDRCWVPWDWCETIKLQKANNSIVIFSPESDTLHAVRAHYDHLATQRTQFYGNLWYHESKTEDKPTWRDFVIEPTAEIKSYVPLKTKLTSTLRSAASKLKN